VGTDKPQDFPGFLPDKGKPVGHVHAQGMGMQRHAEGADENGRRVTNIYVSAKTGKAVVEYEDTYSSDVAEVVSNPPTGHFRVTNIYVDTNTNRTAVEYDDTPQP